MNTEIRIPADAIWGMRPFGEPFALAVGIAGCEWPWTAALAHTSSGGIIKMSNRGTDDQDTRFPHAGKDA